MPRLTPVLSAPMQQLLSDLGAAVRLARLRRGWSAEYLAGQSRIARKTLTRVEHGDAAVALGVYAKVLEAMDMHGELAGVAQADQVEIAVITIGAPQYRAKDARIRQLGPLDGLQQCSAVPG